MEGGGSAKSEGQFFSAKIKALSELGEAQPYKKKNIDCLSWAEVFCLED